MKNILRSLAVLGLLVCLCLSVCGCDYQLLTNDQLQSKIDEAYSQGLEDGLGQSADEPEDTEEYTEEYTEPEEEPEYEPEYEPEEEPEPEPEETEESEVTVYVTNYGIKYHTGDCQYLATSCIPKTLSEAQRAGYGPCSVCHPPQ